MFCIFAAASAPFLLSRSSTSCSFHEHSAPQLAGGLEWTAAAAAGFSAGGITAGITEFTAAMGEPAVDTAADTAELGEPVSRAVPHPAHTAAANPVPVHTTVTGHTGAEHVEPAQ